MAFHVSTSVRVLQCSTIKLRVLQRLISPGPNDGQNRTSVVEGKNRILAVSTQSNCHNVQISTVWCSNFIDLALLTQIISV